METLKMLEEEEDKARQRKEAFRGQIRDTLKNKINYIFKDFTVTTLGIDTCRDKILIDLKPKKKQPPSDEWPIITMNELIKLKIAVNAKDISLPEIKINPDNYDAKPTVRLVIKGYGD
jgi:hypothetical protein